MQADFRVLPRPSAKVIFCTVSDGAVLLSMRSEEYFGLNRVGALVWGLLDEARSLDDLVGRVRAEFPTVPREVIQTDVTDLLRQLQANQLVQ